MVGHFADPTLTNLECEQGLISLFFLRCGALCILYDYKRRKIVALLPGSIESAAFRFSATSAALTTVHRSGGHGRHIQLATHLDLDLRPHRHWASEGFLVASLAWSWSEQYLEVFLLLVVHFLKNVEDWWGWGLEARCDVLSWACED